MGIDPSLCGRYLTALVDDIQRSYAGSKLETGDG